MPKPTDQSRSSSMKPPKVPTVAKEGTIEPEWAAEVHLKIREQIRSILRERQRQQLVDLAAQACDRLWDALAAGQDPSHEWLDVLDEARAMGIADKEITAAQRGGKVIYRVVHRTHGADPWPYFAKSTAFEKCESRALREHAGADLRWGTASEDGEASPSSPWVLSRFDAGGDLVETGYTVTPLPTALSPLLGGGSTDGQI